jgi:hypothetical protein
VDLRPPTVVRLERALAHWSSSTVRRLITGQARSCRVPRGRTQVDTPASDRRSRDMAQPVNGKGDPGLGQTNPSHPAPGQPVPHVYHVGHFRFPQRIRRRGRSLWKINVRRPNRKSKLPTRGRGNRGAAHVHTLWTDLWTTSCGR